MNSKFRTRTVTDGQTKPPNTVNSNVCCVVPHRLSHTLVG